MKKNLFRFALLAVVIFTASIGGIRPTKSQDFLIDFDSVTTGSEEYISTDFILQGGITSIESDGSSNDFIIQSINFTSLGVCGNGVIEPGEVCDGTQFAGASCTSFAYVSGTLTCSSDCKTIGTENCSYQTSGGSNQTSGGNRHSNGGGGGRKNPASSDYWNDDSPPKENSEEDSPLADSDNADTATGEKEGEDENDNADKEIRNPGATEEILWPEEVTKEIEQLLPEKTIPDTTTIPDQFPQEKTIVGESPPPVIDEQSPVNNTSKNQEQDSKKSLAESKSLSPEENKHASASPTSEDINIFNHLSPVKNGGIIITRDETPLFVEQVDPDGLYLITYQDEAETILSQETITTDASGLLSFTTKFPLEEEKQYRLTIEKIDNSNALKDSPNKQNKAKEIVHFSLSLEKTEEGVEVMTFGEKNIKKTSYTQEINLGVLDISENNIITGRWKPESEIFVYFQKVEVDKTFQGDITRKKMQNKHIAIEKGATDSKGYFHVNIPKDLAAGRYKAEVIPASWARDKSYVLHKNITFLFTLKQEKPPDKNQPPGNSMWNSKWFHFLILIATLFLILLIIKKKRNKNR